MKLVLTVGADQTLFKESAHHRQVTSMVTEMRINGALKVARDGISSYITLIRHGRPFTCLSIVTWGVDAPRDSSDLAGADFGHSAKAKLEQDLPTGRYRTLRC